MRTEGHAVLDRESDARPHRLLVAGVTAARDVRARDEPEHRRVIADALAEVAVEVDPAQPFFSRKASTRLMSNSAASRR
jgi:hypothetical protein